MKIAHLVSNYHPSVGGTQIFYKGISENCVSIYKDEVEVLTLDSYYGSHSNTYKKIIPAQETINGVSIKRFSFFRNYRFWLSLLHKVIIKSTGKTVAHFERYNIGPWSPSLKKAIDTTNADVISASSSSFLYMLYPLYRKKLANPKPFVFQGAIHFADNEHGQVVADKTLEAIKASEYYMCNTQYEKERLVALGVENDMIVVAGVAVDMEEFKNGSRTKFRLKFQLNNENVLVGYIGRLVATKSIDVLINAFIIAYNQNNNIRLLIAGFESNYVQQLNDIIENIEPKYSKNIFIELNISNTDKINLYHALDIFVLPSVNESFGIVFLEAWSCKKPVIGTAIGAIKSVVSHEVDGLLMKPFDVNSLSENILTLSNNEELRLIYGNNGFIKTQKNYTWEIVTKKYRDTYVLAIEKFKIKTRHYNN